MNYGLESIILNIMRWEVRSKVKYFVETATKRNTKSFYKPNEDDTFVDSENGIFILLDGVSRDKINGIYPNPSPSYEVSEIFAKKVYSYMRKRISLEDDYLKIIKDAFKEGNSEIKKYNQLYKDEFLPGTVGIIAIIKRNQLFYGYIGDCIGILANRTIKKEFTKCQTKLVHEHKKEFTANQIRQDICNNVQHPYAYGVLDGREGALNFVVTGQINLDKYQKMILLTDGLEEVAKKIPLEELISSNAGELISSKLCETSTDDKTVIIVRILDNENDSKNI